MSVANGLWSCLLNGPTVQLEPLGLGRYRIRRKDGGNVIGELDAARVPNAALLAAPEARRSEIAETLAVFRPWLASGATLSVKVARPGTRMSHGFRHYRLRRQGIGACSPTAPAVWLERLRIDAGYAQRRALDPVTEPPLLHPAGRDPWGRVHWLVAQAAAAWARMREAACRDGVTLDLVSGFRSMAYQAAIFRRKLARGLSLEQILAVNAAPGFSEHHSGRAIDITTPGCDPAEEAFEHTEAFAWLGRRGGEFGFVMSYPRDNPFGFVYEPWHWCWHPRVGAS